MDFNFFLVFIYILCGIGVSSAMYHQDQREEEHDTPRIFVWWGHFILALVWPLVVMAYLTKALYVYSKRG